jgi:FAD:protein FMN transferase
LGRSQGVPRELADDGVMNADTGAAVNERHFRAMGSDAHVIIVGGPRGLIDIACPRIADLEDRWSRFVPTSEVNELNRNAGRPVTVSSDTVLLVRRAIEAWRLTGGSFDPTILGAVIRAGYDRSLSDIADERSTAPISALVVGCTDIVIDGATVCLPAGTGFDPGGIGKGLAADLVVAEMLAAGAVGVCINLGGDLRVAGEGPDCGPWTVAIEHPSLDEPVALVGLHAGAVATSTTLRRTWRIDGQTRHHLIDPFTGEPSASDLNLVSVIGGEAWMSEVLAKAMLLRGAERAFDIIDTNIIQALTVDNDGVVRSTPGLKAYIGGARLPDAIANTSSEERP